MRDGNKSPVSAAFFLGLVVVCLVTVSSASPAQSHRRDLKFLEGFSGLSSSYGDITAVIATEARGSKNAIRNEIFVEMAQETAYGLVQDLRNKIDAIISNLIMLDDNDVKNLIKILTSNSQLMFNLNVTLNNIIINDVDGTKNVVDNLQLVDVLNSSPDILQMIFANITGLQYNRIKGNDNSAGNSLNIEAGNGMNTYPDFITGGSGNDRQEPDIVTVGQKRLPSGQELIDLLDTITPIGFSTDLAQQRALSRDGTTRDGTAVNIQLPDVELLLQATMMNEVARGRGNFLDNFLNVAMFNDVDVENIRANVSAILVNKVKGGKFNDLTNFGDIALGLCSGGSRCSARDYSIDVSTTLLNDITGRRNEIVNMVKVVGAIGDNLDIDRPTTAERLLAGASIDELKKSVLDVEALISNTVKPNGLISEVQSIKNKLQNKIEVETMINSRIEDVQVKIRSVIANTVTGSRNYLANLVKIGVANGYTD